MISNYASILSLRSFEDADLHDCTEVCFELSLPFIIRNAPATCTEYTLSDKLTDCYAAR